MFDNIHRKIKMLAKVITIIGIIGSCITGFVMWILPNGFLIGTLVMVIGSLFSWISSFVLYGFGEIIELLTDIRNGDIGKKSINNEIVTNEDYTGNNIKATQDNSTLIDEDVQQVVPEDCWTCPQCKSINSYSEYGETGCPKCGWKL